MACHPFDRNPYTAYFKLDEMELFMQAVMLIFLLMHVTKQATGSR